MLVLVGCLPVAAAEEYCGAFQGSTGVIVTLGAPGEDQALIEGRDGRIEICDLDTSVQTAEANYSEMFDCGVGIEHADMLTASGPWPDAMLFRGDRLLPACPDNTPMDVGASN